MEGLIRQINALIDRRADEGRGKTQAFLRAFEQIAAPSSRRGGSVRCWATQHAWLVMADPVSLHASLWSPEDEVRVDLPRLTNSNSLPRNCRCLLSHEKPTSHGCVLLVADMDRPVFQYCRTDGGQQRHRWYSHEYSFPGFQVVESIAAAQGDFYFAVSLTELLRMELTCYEFSPEPRFTAVEHGKVWLPHGTEWEQASRHLVGSGGELLMVVQYCLLHDGTFQKQDVYRMDFINRRWADVSDLRGRVLLLGPSRFAASFQANELGLVGDSRVYIVSPEMPMYVHDVKAQMNQLFYRRPADQILSSMHTLAANACGFLSG